ncbi:MAG: radical SAM protein [Chloroflexales bacterium]|nr:radical SAM protein [Chloroflexales bacterium]
MTATSTDLLALTNTELVLFLAELGEPAFRARQISRQLYVNLVDDIQQMTDLSLPLRQILASQAHIGSLKLQRVVSADNSLTHKALFNLPTGELIESVLMIYPDRATVCVSTQAGCAMGCTFCATGRLGLLRNLESHHIVEQVLWARRTLRELQRLQPTKPTRPTQTSDGDEWWGTDGGHPDALPQTLGNVVFMGMGEPFANYDRWWQSVERLHDPQGLNIGARGLTVSTVGLVPGIKRLAEESLQINLAISLHAPNDELRSSMIPVNKRWNIAELMATTRAYVAKTGRRVSFEYVLLQGQNDTPAHAAELAEQIGDLLCHVNLIPWNPVPGLPLGRSDRQRVLAFQRVLQEERVPCTVRVERGVSIAAACGQLAGSPITGP